MAIDPCPYVRTVIPIGKEKCTFCGKLAKLEQSTWYVSGGGEDITMPHCEQCLPGVHVLMMNNGARLKFKK